MVKSTHAQVASIIRKTLKENGLKNYKVQAKSYSGGSSVNVYLSNELPATVKKVEEFCNKFEMGHFNGMEDIYEYSNVSDDLPQVKFIFVHNEYSDELKQEAWEYARDYFSGCNEAPANYKEAVNYHIKSMNNWVSTIVHQTLTGYHGKFWTNKKQRIIVK